MSPQYVGSQSGHLVGLQVSLEETQCSPTNVGHTQYVGSLSGFLDGLQVILQEKSPVCVQDDEDA